MSLAEERGEFPYYGRMRIDAHQHFCEVNRFQYPWMPPGKSLLHRTQVNAEMELTRGANTGENAGHMGIVYVLFLLDQKKDQKESSGR